MSEKPTFDDLEKRVQELQQAEAVWKNTKEDLLESERRYRTLFEQNIYPIAIIDHNGHYLDANPAFIGFVEKSKESLLQMRVFDFTPPEKGIKQKKLHTAVWERGGTLETEYFINGKIRILELNIMPFSYKGSDAIIGIGKDITGRKRAEEELRVSEEKFRNLFQYHSAIKMLIDPDSGNIAEANEAAEKFYGWSVAELRKMRIQDINTLSPEQVKAEMEKARTLKCTHFEFRHRLADGSIRDVDVYSSKIEFEGKELLHSIIHDITERKQAEKERDKSISDLQNALSEVKTLSALLPICTHCKNIRDDKGYWSKIEEYIHKHSGAEFSHGICPECAKKYYSEYKLYDD